MMERSTLQEGPEVVSERSWGCHRHSGCVFYCESISCDLNTFEELLRQVITPTLPSPFDSAEPFGGELRAEPLVAGKGGGFGPPAIARHERAGRGSKKEIPIL